MQSLLITACLLNATFADTAMPAAGGGGDGYSTNEAPGNLHSDPADAAVEVGVVRNPNLDGPAESAPGNLRSGTVADAAQEQDRTLLAGSSLLGCFKDDPDRDLEHWDQSQNFGIGLAINCLEHCRQKGYMVAGLQWYGECHCGNTWGKYGKGDIDTDCFGCTGGHNNKWGEWHQCIYDLQGLLGCFKDDPDRDLEHWNQSQNFSDGHSADCLEYCRGEGYKVAGLQYYGECHCGNTWDKYGKGDIDADCGGCSGNNNFYGNWHQCIYDLQETTNTNDLDDCEEDCDYQVRLCAFNGMHSASGDCDGVKEACMQEC